MPKAGEMKDYYQVLPLKIWRLQKICTPFVAYPEFNDPLNYLVERRPACGSGHA